MQTKLFRRDFTLVVIGQIISLFGNAILRFALPLYLLRQTGSAALYGGITALRDCAADVESMRQEYDARRKVIYKGLVDMGLPVFEPKGAFYIFPDISCTGMNSEEFCEKLVKEEKVAVVPGTAFGACGENHVRISYAASMETIKEALKRMARFVKKYRK